MKQLSESGQRQLERLEGLPGGKPALVAYQDQAGVWTNGFGHTQGVGPSTPIIDEAQARRNLLADVRWAVQAVNEKVTVALNQNQFDALVLFVFNVGEAAFVGSTLLKKLNAGKLDEAPMEMARWNKITVNGKKVVSKGLVNRRAAEIALFTRIPDDTVLPATETGTPPTPVAPAKSVVSTKTGATVIGTLLSGGGAAALQGVSNAQTYINAVNGVLGGNASEKQWYQVATMVFVAAAVGFSLWTLIHKSKSMKE